MPQRTLLLIVACLTILCFVWMVKGSLCGLRIQQGSAVFVATFFTSGTELVALTGGSLFSTNATIIVLYSFDINLPT
ncbi:Hok/Gef family protein [Salmonella enterica]|nr:Hok/Gef family protein [Salmonella enterica subsp. enterica serovar Oranienburg]EKK3319361.1 Hok/Gef family protein [Salmonella enterica]MIP06402.1 Hok/Gef family protein [Salmonella enterica subsp. enterica serovar Oranienburg]